MVVLLVRPGGRHLYLPAILPVPSPSFFPMLAAAERFIEKYVRGLRCCESVHRMQYAMHAPDTAQSQTRLLCGEHCPPPPVPHVCGRDVVFIPIPRRADEPRNTTLSVSSASWLLLLGKTSLGGAGTGCSLGLQLCGREICVTAQDTVHPKDPVLVNSEIVSDF